MTALLQDFGEGPGGDLSQYGLNGAILDLDEARAAVARAEVKA